MEYKDPAEEEWEKFQKAMQVETQVANISCDTPDISVYLQDHTTFCKVLVT